jgi:hypothetical protein
VAGTVFGTSKIRIGEQMQVIEDPSGRFPFVLSPKENGHSTQ